MLVSEGSLPGLKTVLRSRVADDRGHFSRIFCMEELESLGFTRPVAQINHSVTLKRGTARGLHFQFPPHGEDKFVTCLRGGVFDVAVDLRRDSPTFLQWHGEVLSEANASSMFIPEGFAHGFQCLAEGSELLYLHSEVYVPSAEGALNVRDPILDIRWPLTLSGLSPRDEGHPYLTADFSGL